MKLGIMQPYFFPYLGYFDIIRSVDQWVVFDTAQYMRHGWVNRNRILHPTSGWQYIIAPLRKHSLNTAIKDVETSESIPWKQKIIGQLVHYRKSAPFYRETVNLVEECFAYEGTSLSELNVFLLDKVCSYLQLHFCRQLFSEMHIELEPVEAPGDWALRIAEKMGASQYVNPIGGRQLFDPQAFARAGIRLEIREAPLMSYSCRGYSFEPGLSIIDVLMWNDKRVIRDYLDLCQSSSGSQEVINQCRV